VVKEDCSTVCNCVVHVPYLTWHWPAVAQLCYRIRVGVRAVLWCSSFPFPRILSGLDRHRLPLKFDRSHRGFCFVEYASKAEARKVKEVHINR
jgi:hypothetical protein